MPACVCVCVCGMQNPEKQKSRGSVQQPGTQFQVMMSDSTVQPQMDRD